jgi:predicted nucleotidyltransferase
MGYDGLISPTSASLSFDETVDALRCSPRVRAVMLLGSTGTDEFTEVSDIDLLLIVADYPSRFGIEVSIIDGRIADLVIVGDDAAEGLGMSEVDGNLDARLISPDEWPYVHWLAEARPLHDPDELARAAHNRAVQLAPLRPSISAEDQRVTRSYVSHDLRVNEALVRRAETDPDIHAALGMRQIHTFVSAVLAWLKARDVRGRGWKKNIAYIADTDPEFHSIITSWLAATTIHDRHALFEQAVRHALDPLGGPVPEGMISPGPNTVWEDLLTPG